MGQTLSSETLSISGGDGYRYWVGLNMKPSEIGCKKTVYKGVLLGHGPRQWEKVVVKAFTHIPGTKESWTHELNKADVSKHLAAKFTQECPSMHKIRIVIPGIVQMDRVSNVNKWLASKDDGRGLTEDEWISVEELIPGEMGRFCPWSTKHAEAHAESEYMQAFSHFTYKYTNGELVACDFQGKFDPKTSKYIFTDSSIHSIYKLYGLFDQGEHGIAEFFKLHRCNDICSSWSRPTPLTPPPSFEAACTLFHNLTPTSKFENIVYPADSSETMACDRETERKRHHSEFHQQVRHGPENLLTGHHTFQRTFSSGTNGETLREGNQNASSPPTYKNLPSSADDDSQPPSYDSVVNPRIDNHAHAKTLEEMNNGRERSKTCNDLRFLQRSATDSLLLHRNRHTHKCSDTHCRLCFSSYLDQQASSTAIMSNKKSYNYDSEPSLAFPSAPPEENDSMSGT